MRITALILQAFIVGLIIGGFYGDALGLGNAGTKSRTIETLEATVATQGRTLETKDEAIAELEKQVETQETIIATQEEIIALLEVRDRADLPAIPFEFEAEN